jgi:hypothetical protein
MVAITKRSTLLLDSLLDSFYISDPELYYIKDLFSKIFLRPDFRLALGSSLSLQLAFFTSVRIHTKQ